MKHVDWRVHTALLFVQVMFGAFHVTGKAVLAYLPPLGVAGLRVLCATPLLLATAWVLEGNPFRLKVRELPTLALLGLLGVFANQVLFIMGLKFTTATNAGIIMPSIPVFTVAIAAIFGIERLRMGQVGGIALAVAGALIMLNPLNFSLGQDKVLGNILLLINSVCYAGFLVLQRPVLKRVPPLTLTAWAFFFGGLGVTIISWPQVSELSWSAVPGSVWWGMAFIILVPTTINYALNTWAVRQSSPSLVAGYTTLQPLSAATLAALFLGEAVGWREAAGLLLIVAGLLLVNRGLKRAVAVPGAEIMKPTTLAK